MNSSAIALAGTTKALTRACIFIHISGLDDEHADRVQTLEDAPSALPAVEIRTMRSTDAVIGRGDGMEMRDVLTRFVQTKGRPEH